MASATIKFPDGRTESKNIITAFEKNDTNVITFDTDKVDNGHKVVGVSYSVDGMYQNVVDMEKWKEVKGYLVEGLHDRITNEEYRVVSPEILVTEDPYRELALRDENYDNLVANYNKFLATKNVEQTSAQVEESVVEDIPTMGVSEEAPSMESIVLQQPQELEEQKVINNDVFPSMDVSAPDLNMGQVSESENLYQDITKPSDVVQTQEEIIPDMTTQINPTIENVVLVQEDSNSINFPEVSSQIQEPVFKTPISLENDSQPQETISDNRNEGLILDFPNIPTPDALIQEAPTSQEIEDAAAINPQTDIPNKEESVITNSYLKSADDLITKMEETTKEYIQSMKEMRAVIESILKEAKGINDLSKQTFEKAQNIVPLMQEEDPSLKRVA